MNTTKGHEMTPAERLADMRAKAQSTKPVDWTAVRRATAASPRTESEWALVDAYAR